MGRNRVSDFSMCKLQYDVIIDIAPIHFFMGNVNENYSICLTLLQTSLQNNLNISGAIRNVHVLQNRVIKTFLIMHVLQNGAINIYLPDNSCTPERSYQNLPDNSCTPEQSYQNLPDNSCTP